jgi:hypothetical protein
VSAGDSFPLRCTSQEAVERLRLRHGVPEGEGKVLVEEAHRDGVSVSRRHSVRITRLDEGIYLVQGER